MHRGFITLSVAASLAAAVIASACGSSAASGEKAIINNLKDPADVFVTLGVAGLGCAGKVYHLAADGARVSNCKPIAGISNGFLVVGMYPSADIAERQYRRYCNAHGWSLYRHGENWRGVIDWTRGKGVPLSVAKKIALALHTDLHPPCAGGSPPDW